MPEAGRIAVAGDAARAGEAEAAFARVIAADPGVWEAHFGQGLLARLRGDTASAAEAFRRAVEIDPDAATLVEDLGRPLTS
ncbi:MAG: tetratricopeptide repeat protein [Chloroflexi bacterium]|nr:tetratricopeptide repeat protein [Chloroflexota bacterium]